jgi:cytochrome c biogenesis protein CcmG/thiol:disulfide interchange protein DsbE
VARRTPRRGRILRWSVVWGLSAAVLLACAGPSRDVRRDDFAAPPVEPIAVQGLEGCAGLVDEESAGEASDRLPSVELPCLNRAQEVDVSRLAGPAVVNLWASWCGPCRKEMPMLAREAERHREVQFVGINTQDRQEAAADLLTRTGVTYPQLVDVDAVVLGDTRVPGLPVTLAVDADGRIVDKVIGEVSRSELDTLLDSITEGY